MLLGCGLWRQEAVNLRHGHIQQREARSVIVDLVGKRNKVRTVPMASWIKVALGSWRQAACITEGRIFRSFRKGDYLDGDRMTSQAVWEVVTTYADQLGFIKSCATRPAPHMCQAGAQGWGGD